MKTKVAISRYLLDEKTELLYTAIESNNEIAVKDSLAAGANVHALVDIRKESFLLKAIEKGNNNIIKTIIDAGIDVDMVDMFGKSPLHEAIAKSNEIAVKNLLAAGAKIFNIHNYQLLENGNSIILKILADAGANINMVDFSSRTLLSNAIIRDDKSAIKTLLNAGANVNIVDKYGKTSLEYLVEGSTESEEYNVFIKALLCNLQISSYQSHPNASIDKALSEAIRLNKLSVVKLINDYKIIAKFMNIIFNDDTEISVNTISPEEIFAIIKAIMENQEFIISYFYNKQNTLQISEISSLRSAFEDLHKIAKANTDERVMPTEQLAQDKQVVAELSKQKGVIIEQLRQKFSEFRKDMSVLEKHIIYMLNNGVIEDDISTLKETLENPQIDNKDHIYEIPQKPLAQNASTFCNMNVVQLLQLNGRECLGDGDVLKQFIAATRKSSERQIEILKILFNNPESWQEFTALYNKIKFNIDQVLFIEVDQFSNKFLTECSQFQTAVYIEQVQINCQLQDQLNEAEQRITTQDKQIVDMSRQLTTVQAQAAKTENILNKLLGILETSGLLEQMDLSTLVQTDDHNVDNVNIAGDTSVISE